MPITGTADRRLGTRAAWTGRSAGWGIYLALCGADALPVAIGRAPGSAPPHRALTAARRERRMRCGVCGVVILCFAMPRILPMQEPRTHVRACACDLSHCVHAPCAVRFTCGPRGKVNASQQHTAPTARRDGYLRCRSTAAVSSAALTLPAAKAISRAARLTVSGAGGTGHSGHTGSAWLSWREPLAVGATRR